MQQTATQLAVLVTASVEGDAMGRNLLNRGVSLVGATGSLLQLRRSLVRGCLRSPIVLCITLDAPTIRRHGQTIASILDDRCSFPTPVHAVGVRMNEGLPDSWQSLGCDAIADDQMHLESALGEFDQQTMAHGDRFSFASTDSLLERFMKNQPSGADTRTSDFRWHRR